MLENTHSFNGMLILTLMSYVLSDYSLILSRHPCGSISLADIIKSSLVLSSNKITPMVTCIVHRILLISEIIQNFVCDDLMLHCTDVVAQYALSHATC